MKYTGEIVDLSECDRILAIMIADGKMYFSDCDHQDCLQQYCEDLGIDSGLDWYNDNYDRVYAEAVKKTRELFEDETKEIYGFDVFDGYENQYYLTAHFPSNLEKCFDMVIKYAKENDCLLATFTDSSYVVKLVDMEQHNLDEIIHKADSSKANKDNKAKENNKENLEL